MSASEIIVRIVMGLVILGLAIEFAAGLCMTDLPERLSLPKRFSLRPTKGWELMAIGQGHFFRGRGDPRDLRRREVVFVSEAPRC
jgi:hypothetical protein